MEERLHQQVNMSRLATFLMAREDDEVAAEVQNVKKDVEAGNPNGRSLESHEVKLVSVMSDISCSCSEWEHEEDADDEAESRRSEGNASIDVSNFQQMETMFNPFKKETSPQLEATSNNYSKNKKALQTRRQSTPTTNVTISSGSTTLSNSDVECAIPEFSDTPKKGARKGIPKGNCHTSSTKESIDQCEILKKTFEDNDCTTLTDDPESRVAHRMKGPLLALVVCLGVLIVMLVVAVLVMTILTIFRQPSSHHLTTATSSSAGLSLAPQPAPVMSPSLSPALQPTLH